MKLQYLSTSPYSDDTSRYKVVEFPETIGELFKEVLLRTKKWGSLYLLSPYYKKEIAEYKWGKVIKPLPEEYKDRKINCLMMEEAWTCEDYLIT